MGHYAVSAVGADRPGIVAAVTGVFLENGCNLEDTSMTILRGHFAMMLVVAAPDGLEQEACCAFSQIPGLPPATAGLMVMEIVPLAVIVVLT